MIRHKDGGQVHQKDGGQVHQKDGGQVGQTISHYKILLYIKKYHEDL
jgi:hypothetical protein